MEFGEMAHYEDFGIFANFRYLRIFSQKTIIGEKTCEICEK
jgi:hypothetical protein